MNGKTRELIAYFNKNLDKKWVINDSEKFLEGNNCRTITELCNKYNFFDNFRFVRLKENSQKKGYIARQEYIPNTYVEESRLSTEGAYELYTEKQIENYLNNRKLHEYVKFLINMRINEINFTNSTDHLDYLESNLNINLDDVKNNKKENNLYNTKLYQLINSLEIEYEIDNFEELKNINGLKRIAELAKYFSISERKLFYIKKKNYMLKEINLHIAVSSGLYYEKEDIKSRCEEDYDLDDNLLIREYINKLSAIEEYINLKSNCKKQKKS